MCQERRGSGPVQQLARPTIDQAEPGAWLAPSAGPGDLLFNAAKVLLPPIIRVAATPHRPRLSVSGQHITNQALEQICRCGTQAVAICCAVLRLRTTVTNPSVRPVMPRRQGGERYRGANVLVLRESIQIARLTHGRLSAHRCGTPRKAAI